MGYCLAILFSNIPYHISYRALNNAPHHIHLKKFWKWFALNGRKNIYILGNLIALQVFLRNEIPGNNNLLKVTSTYKRVWLIFVLKGIPSKKKSISKINVACSNTKFFSFYYEAWHTRNTDIFKIRDIFRTMEYSELKIPTVFTFLSNIFYCLSEIIPGYNYFL